MTQNTKTEQLQKLAEQILGNNQLDALFHVFIYLFHVSVCFERCDARNI